MRAVLDNSRALLGWLWNHRLASILAPGVIVAVGYGLWAGWDWLQAGGQSNGATLRNIALVFAAVVGLPLAWWRSYVAQRQADTAQRGLLNERYQKGAEMLGGSVQSVRLGGIYALQRLAEEHPQQYAAQILRLFCAFARHPTEDVDKKPDSEAKVLPRADIQAVMEVIGAYDELIPTLDMRILNLREADLRNISLFRANLSGADLLGADLSGAILANTNLSSAVLAAANLARAILSSANLTGANLERARGMTQNQLDLACADPSRPPDLGRDTLDAETDQPLVWQGRPSKDSS